MGRSRSYPSIGLPEAIQRARAIFQKSGKAPTTEAAIVTEWGFSGVHGTSGRLLSALRQYGLLEKRDDSLMALTRRALTILLEPSESVERSEAIKKAAQEPTMFTEIAEAFPDGIPSNEGLVLRLVRDPNWGFSPKGAEQLVAVLRETLDLVGAPDGRYSTEGDGGDVHEGDPLAPHERDNPLKNQERREMPSTSEVAKKDWDLTIPLVEGGQAILRVPIPVTDEDFDMLKSVITSNLDAMRRAIVRPPQRGGGDADDAE